MKKSFIIALMFVFPLLTNAQVATTTVEEQYQSALRQVIVLLQQQVALLIEQLNALQTHTATISPSYTYTPVTPVSIVIPEIPTPAPVPQPTPSPTPTFGSTQLLPDYTWSTLNVSENTSLYTFTNSSTSPLVFTKVNVTIAPITTLNSPQQVTFEVWQGNNNKHLPFITTSPTATTTATIPVNMTIPQGKTETIRLEIHAYNVGNPNDRYSIELLSIE